MKKLLALFFGVLTLSTFSIAAQAEELNQEEDLCSYSKTEDAAYSSYVVSVRKKLKVEQGEVFITKVFLKNTGNRPWFSYGNSCGEHAIFLGSDFPRDHQSLFFMKSIVDGEATGWFSNNRIKMDQERINPGEIASFTFSAVAPEHDDIIRENFSPVIDGLMWIEDSRIEMDLIVGDSVEIGDESRKRFSYSNGSGSLLSIPLDGEQTLKVDVSEQLLYVYLGDYLVRTFPVSSGAYDTPTPYGETKIAFKQEVRVGQKAPHYIMPKFMWFRAGGYGFHSLPKLGNDGGVFWTEALNHIQRRVSHGCVRLLPWDADWVYAFTKVGARVVVQP